MLGKIILTLLVVTIAFVYVRERRQQTQQANSKSTGTTAGEKESTSSRGGKPRPVSDFRVAAYLFLFLMFSIAAGLYFQRWQLNHTVLNVNLYRDSSNEPVTYQVYRYQLSNRSFVTTDGRQITVADSERMEVIEP